METTQISNNRLINIPFVPAITVLGIYLPNTRPLIQKDVSIYLYINTPMFIEKFSIYYIYIYVHRKSLYNSQDMETT